MNICVVVVYTGRECSASATKTYIKQTVRYVKLWNYFNGLNSLSFIWNCYHIDKNYKGSIFCS